MNSPKIFVGWAAVSSQPQASEEKISLTDQLYDNIIHSRRYGKLLCQLVVPGESRDITKFDDAARSVMGWRIDDSFDNLSGSELKLAIDSKLQGLRNEATIYPYAELERLKDSASFDVFIFRNLGRVGRDAALSMTVMSLCHRAGIITYATTAPPASIEDAGATYHRALLNAITAVGYENEIRELGERHRSGIARRVESGKFPGAIPFGWTAIRNSAGKIAKYAIDEDAATIIRIIVDLYLNHGMGMMAIAERLNVMGHKAPVADSWKKNNVNAILDRILRYAGYNEINKRSKRRKYIRAKGNWPAIIDEDTARAVIAERKAREGSPRSTSNTYRFSRMVWCRECERAMPIHHIVRSYTKKDGTVKTYRTRQYRCSSGHGSVSENRVAKYIAGAIKLLQTRGEAQHISIEAPEPKPSTTVEDITDINAKIDKVRAGIARADTDFYVNSTMDENRHKAITEGGNQRIEVLMAELNRLQEQLHNDEQSEKRNERIEEVLELGLDMLADPDIRRANTWLRQHIRVYTFHGEILRADFL